MPINFWLTPHIIERLKKERGVDDVEAYLKMDIRFIDYQAQPEENDFSRYTKDFPENTTVDSWGCGQMPVGLYHFYKDQYPMMDKVKSIADLEQYPFPERRTMCGKK